MPCELADSYGYRAADGTFVGVSGSQVFAVPSTPNLTVSYGGVWRPMNGLNPLISGGTAFKYGAVAVTDPDGQWSLTLPYAAAETHPLQPPAQWTLVFPDGNKLTGVVPSDAGPLSIDDLVTTHAWAWASHVYVAPVTAGVFAKGTAVFSGASANSATLFLSPFSTNTYQLTLTPSVDSNDGTIPRVAWSSKTTGGVHHRGRLRRLRWQRRLGGFTVTRNILLFVLALAGCAPAYAAPITGSKTDTLVLNPLASAPSCPTGLACLYARSSDNQIYDVDAAGLVLKHHAAKSFRTSSSCAGLASPANGDVCFDTSIPAFRFYNSGWSTAAADDALVVHKSGTETITGAKTFSTPVALNGASLGGARITALGSPHGIDRRRHQGLRRCRRARDLVLTKRV